MQEKHYSVKDARSRRVHNCYCKPRHLIWCDCGRVHAEFEKGADCSNCGGAVDKAVHKDEQDAI